MLVHKIQKVNMQVQQAICNTLEELYMMRGVGRVDSQNLFLRMEMTRTTVHTFEVSGAKFKGDMWASF